DAAVPVRQQGDARPFVGFFPRVRVPHRLGAARGLHGLAVAEVAPAATRRDLDDTEARGEAQRAAAFVQPRGELGVAALAAVALQQVPGVALQREARGERYAQVHAQPAEDAAQ